LVVRQESDREAARSCGAGADRFHNTGFAAAQQDKAAFGKALADDEGRFPRLRRGVARTDNPDRDATRRAAFRLQPTYRRAEGYRLTTDTAVRLPSPRRRVESPEARAGQQGAGAVEPQPGLHVEGSAGQQQPGQLLRHAQHRVMAGVEFGPFGAKAFGGAALMRLAR